MNRVILPLWMYDNFIHYEYVGQGEYPVSILQSKLDSNVLNWLKGKMFRLIKSNKGSRTFLEIEFMNPSDAILFKLTWM